ncbi:MAG: M15 family metallopeptidase [Methylobacter sp.]|uniref:M15 family metallopeptidase n=1 Tax=Methylobacter sp. TaxID=2051955 RepID=UPI0025EE3420|nr:M15 family metallopeptidase [Methylobacter sp.]MCK9622190.1 M15 family metallopeptidase [Methylobacter sp.]
MINSRKLEDLHPVVERMCREFIAECRKQDIDILITSTYRDNESQNAIYAQGRTKAGPRVTNAKGGQSFHNYRCAFDFVPIVNGKADWTNTMTFRKCGDIAKQLGLEWAGDWVHFKELAHCQYTGGLKLADLQSGKQIA